MGDVCSANRTAVRFGFILTNDFSLLAFSCFIEALRQLEDHGTLTGRRFCSWDVLGQPDEPIQASCGVAITPTSLFSDPENFDYVVVIGGRHAAQLADEAIRFLIRVAKLQKPLVAIDTGTFVVARAGLMSNRRFCIHWFHHHEFVEEFPAYRASMDQIFLVDGDFISCAGGTWSTDLAIHLITEIWGRTEASRAISLMGLERMRSASHYQAPYFDGAPIISDPIVLAAIQMIERNCSQPPSVEELARKMGFSVKQLERKFDRAVGMKPAEFSRTIRLRFGHWLLLNSSRSIVQIAFDCGFSDQSHFTRQFRRLFDITPSQLRIRNG